MTQLVLARQGEITPEMKEVASREGVSLEYIREEVAEGAVVILRNKKRRNAKPLGVGRGLRTKVSASVGLYGQGKQEGELAKIRAAVEAGADAIMDLSVSGDIDGMRRAALEATSTPVGTLPIYQAFAKAARKYGSSLKMEVEELFEVIERQAEEGVDFFGSIAVSP